MPVRRHGKGALAVARTRLEAVAAINRLVSAGLERNFGNAAALAARGLEHLALASAATAAALVATAAPAGLASRATIGATVRLVGEALHREELLLAGGERELTSAIHAGQHFCGVHKLTNESPEDRLSLYSGTDSLVPQNVNYADFETLGNRLTIHHLRKPGLHSPKDSFRTGVRWSREWRASGAPW